MGQTIVRFSAGRSLKTGLIQAWTRGWPAHVDFVVDDGWLLGSEPGHGVQYMREPGNRRIHDLVLPVDLGYTYAMTQIGKGYDWLGLIGCGLRWPRLHGEDTWFCSELVVASLEMAQFPVLDEYDMTHPQIFSPWDLLQTLTPLAVEQIEGESHA